MTQQGGGNSQRHSRLVLVGNGRVITSGGRRRACLRLARMGARGSSASQRRGQRVRYSICRRPASVRQLWTAPSPTRDRVGPHRTGGGTSRPGRRGALPADSRGRTGGGDLGLGLPPPLRAAGLGRFQRHGLPRRAGAVVLLASSSRVHRGDLRRPGGRMEADQRAHGVRAGSLCWWRPSARRERSIGGHGSH